MGVAHSGAEVAARMNKVAEATRVAQAKAVKLAADALRGGVIAASPGQLRNVGRGARLGVIVRVQGGAHPTATGKAVGPWAIIEYDTPRHLIGIGRGRGRRAKVKVVNGAARGGMLKGGGYTHPVRGPIVHPGTHGKHVFHKGVAAATPAAKAVLAKSSIQAVKEMFG